MCVYISSHTWSQSTCDTQKMYKVTTLIQNHSSIVAGRWVSHYALNNYVSTIKVCVLLSPRRESGAFYLVSHYFSETWLSFFLNLKLLRHNNGKGRLFERTVPTHLLEILTSFVFKNAVDGNFMLQYRQEDKKAIALQFNNAKGNIYILLTWIYVHFVTSSFQTTQTLIYKCT